MWTGRTLRTKPKRLCEAGKFAGSFHQNPLRALCAQEGSDQFLCCSSLIQKRGDSLVPRVLPAMQLTFEIAAQIGIDPTRDFGPG